MEETKVSIYTFGKDNAIFYVNFPPDRNLKKQIFNLFANYDVHLHMKDVVNDEDIDYNKDILDTIYSLGIFKITINNGFNETKIFEKPPKESFMRKDFIDYFNSYKNNLPKVGLISFVDNMVGKTANATKVIFTEWLPRMQNIEVVTNIKNWPERYDVFSCNIIMIQDYSFFVLFERTVENTWSAISYVEIGKDVFNKDSANFLTRTKMLQIFSMDSNIENIFKLWSEKYNERRTLCNQPTIEVTFYDLLIYLYRLQELITKIQSKCQTKTLLWTTKHNEFIHEFREYSNVYTMEFRQAVLEDFSKNGNASETPYAFINDFFLPN